MESPHSRARVSTRSAYVRRERRHKFQLGEIVTLMAAAGGAGPKDSKRDITGANFEITRLLPEQSQGFEYRVKHCATGQERVVAEDSILTPAE